MSAATTPPLATLTIAGVSTQDDVSLEKPWTAKFTAEPRIEIAGKVISYLPTPGEPGVVQEFPYGGGRLSADSSIFIVFDQPIKPKAAAKLIHLWTNNVADHEEKPGQEAEIPINLSNPSSGRLQGYTLNPKQIIEVKGVSPLSPGKSVSLRVEDGRPGESKLVYNYEVAGPLELKAISCGYSYERSVCQWEGSKLRTDGNEIVLEYTNQLANGDSQLKADIKISPELKNVNVWGGGSWDSNGRISISAAFEPGLSRQA